MSMSENRKSFERIARTVARVVTGVAPTYTIARESWPDLGLESFLIADGDTILGRVRTDGESITFRPPTSEWAEAESRHG